MQVTETGSVRVDLVGGTLDIEPIHLILKNAITLNVATTHEAVVTMTKNESDKIRFFSEDYHADYEFPLDLFKKDELKEEVFGPMLFLSLILKNLKVKEGLDIKLKSGAPAGSGLGGSSAMGITFYKAYKTLYKKPYSVIDAVSFVKGVEGIILNQGMPGFQDYYPALLGGILALKGAPGIVKAEQLFTPTLKKILEERITLIYSGISRNSGINNWDVYKKFFDKDYEVRKAMQDIATVSYDTYQAILDKDYERMLKNIGEEGKLRTTLAPGITPSEIENFMKNLPTHIGYKMCGAGGGGCFILTHKKDDKELIRRKLNEGSMKELPFIIKEPI